MNNEKDWLTTGEVVELLQELEMPGVTRQAVLRWIRAGELPSVRYKKGGRNYVERSTVLQFAQQSQRRQPAPVRQSSPA